MRRNRIRTKATTVVAVLAALVAGAAPAQAQSPPTLAGENLTGTTFTTTGSCEASGPSSYSFQSEGVATGPYNGTFTESGTFALGPDVGTNNRGVVAFQSTFRIDAQDGTVVTGTKSLLVSDSGICLESAEQPRLVNFSARVTYEATIAGPGGTSRVEGEAVVRGTESSAGSVTPEPVQQFTETFVTSSPVDLPPAAVTLDPPAATNPVGTQHCVTATVRDAAGNPVSGVTVRFQVTGAAQASGSATTDGDGRATFCYGGPDFPGADAITAYADTDGDAAQDPGEPVGAAEKTWVLPASTPGCSASFGGHIISAEGSGKATFSGSAVATADGIEGAPVYLDHPGEVRIKSTAILALVCAGKTATLYGTATVEGEETLYRIVVHDGGEPGSGKDTYGILLASGYYSGEQFLRGGNVQVDSV